jgi:DNA polymerase III subunit epsilon
LYGENLVFTGTLSLPRTEASYKAALAGCKIQDGINKQTTILVVGIQDHFTTGHREKSSKQIKAEKLIQQGQNIKIISENDFIKIISLPER